MRAAFVSLLKATSSRHGRGQIAAAITLGVICGLIPKTCGLFVALLALVYFLPVHLLLAVTVTLVVSWLSQPLVNTFDELGTYSLKHPDWSEFWLRLDRYALIPWLGLHNTIVHGAALTSAVLCLPLLLVSHGLAAWVLPRRDPILLDQAMVVGQSGLTVEDYTSRALEYVDTQADAFALEDSEDCEQLEASREAATPAAIGLSPAEPLETLAHHTSIDESATRIEQILVEYGSEDFPQGTGGDDVLQRAARLVSAVDELLITFQAEEEALFDELPVDDDSWAVSDMPEQVSATQLLPPDDLIQDVMDRDDLFRTDMSHGSQAMSTNAPTPTHDSASLAPGRLENAPRRNRAQPGRASREGEVLRNLLHHLRQLKELDAKEKV